MFRVDWTKTIALCPTILAFRGYRALAMIGQSAGLYVVYLPVPARFGEFNFNSSAFTVSRAFSSGAMACNSDRVASIMFLIFVVLCEFIIYPTEQLCDKIYGSYKRSAKHEVRGSFIPPLIPPQAGGESCPDKLGGKSLWFLLHSCFT